MSKEAASSELELLGDFFPACEAFTDETAPDLEDPTELLLFLNFLRPTALPKASARFVPPEAGTTPPEVTPPKTGASVPTLPLLALQ